MMLGISPSETVFRLARLRLADGVPMAIERAAVPLRFLGGAPPAEDSLYAALEASGFRPVRALQRLRAVVIGAADGALLEIPEGSAALDIHRIAYIADGRRVEFTRSFYRSDTYDFVAELTLSPGAPSALRRSGAMSGTLMAAEIAETGDGFASAAAGQRERDGRPRSGASRRRTFLCRNHCARKLGPRRPFSQACDRAQGRTCLCFAGTVDRLALPRAAASRPRGRDHHFPVGPQPGHRRHAKRGERRRRDDHRPGQRRRVAGRARRRRAPAAARGRRAVGCSDQVDDRFAGRRPVARRALERRRRTRGRARAAAFDTGRVRRFAARRRGGDARSSGLAVRHRPRSRPLPSQPRRR